MVVARYFKGDIVMASVDGYGTDTYVYLQVIQGYPFHCTKKLI